MSLVNHHQVSALQADILRMQGFKPASTQHASVLAFMREAFPTGSFPLGCMHEFLTGSVSSAAATAGFISSILSSLLQKHGTVVWINRQRMIFPPALKNLGLEPDKFIFIDVAREKDIAWVMEEALKCSALTAVIGEMPVLDFTTSRRLQLAVEESKVTGFVIRPHRPKITTTACVSRWSVSSIPCIPIDDLPGVGYAAWRLELQRMRNGKTGTWEVYWKDNRFVPITRTTVSESFTQRQAG